MTGAPQPEVRVSPFSGPPYTTLGSDSQGRSTATVRLQALTPERVMLCQNLASLTIVGITILSASITPALFFGSFLLWFAHGVITQEFAYKLTPVTDIVFTATEFRVQREGHWDVYDRTIRHSFALIEHDETKNEQERHKVAIARAQLRREVIRPQRIYGQSFHLIYEYLGQRQDITSIYGEKIAREIVTRLQALDALMDAQLNMGDAPVSDPGQQWDPQPGDSPQAGDLP